MQNLARGVEEGDGRGRTSVLEAWLRDHPFLTTVKMQNQYDSVAPFYFAGPNWTQSNITHERRVIEYAMRYFSLAEEMYRKGCKPVLVTRMKRLLNAMEHYRACARPAQAGAGRRITSLAELKQRLDAL